MYIGDQTFLAQDWPWIYQWYDIIKQSLFSFKIPYHVSMFEHEMLTGEHIFGNRYFAMSPISHASPQLLLLSIMDVQSFMNFQIILLYSIGTVGVWKWIKKLKLSSSAGSFLFILYSFNGAIITKMGIGYIQMGALFLIPWFLWLLMKLVETNHKGINISFIVSLEISLFLFFVLLQGSFHVFYQMALVGFSVLIFYRKLFFVYCSSILISFILCSYYLIPNFLFSNYSSVMRTIHWPGYENLLHILKNLIYPYTAKIDASWEYSIYISLVGFVFIAASLFLQLIKLKDKIYYDEYIVRYNKKILLSITLIMFIFLPFLIQHRSNFPEIFGMYSIKYLIILILYTFFILLFAFLTIYLYKILNDNKDLIKSEVNILQSLFLYPWQTKRYLFGLLIILLFSIGPFMGIVYSTVQTIIPIPAIDRVPSRLMIYPLIFLFLISAVGFDSLYSKISIKYSAKIKWGSLFLLIFLLLLHSADWSISNTENVWINVETGMNILIVEPRYVFKTEILNFVNDDFYKQIVNISFILTFISFFVISFIYFIIKNKENYKIFNRYFSLKSSL